MNFAYGTRLVCLSLEIFFLVNLVSSTAVLGVSKYFVRAALTVPPQRAERWFLILRLLPIILSASAVLALCVPSYLRYEENAGSEQLGPFCLTIAALGLGLCLTSACRGIFAFWQSHCVEQRCKNMRRMYLSRQLPETSIFLTPQGDKRLPMLALVGILRPRLIVSQFLLDALTVEQVDVVLSHERAHLVSRDNLKRLLFVLAPDIFPFTSLFCRTEKQWQHYAELTADDKAAAGRPERSLALAEALIRVARLGKSGYSLHLASSLTTPNVELAMRVDRLLAVQAPDTQGKAPAYFERIFLLLCGAVLACTALPRLLSVLYPWLETLLH